MKKTMMLKFEELVELWKRSSRHVSVAQLLGLTVSDSAVERDHGVYAVETLRERFRGTWWLVSWPAHVTGNVITRGVQCKYVGDSPCGVRPRSRASRR